MTKKTKEVIGSFGQIQIWLQVERHPKILEGHDRAVIEITWKEIFIGNGGNYKIKWKDVTQLDITDDGFDLKSKRHQVVASHPNNNNNNNNNNNWKKCRSFLEKCWNKRLEKDEKKKRQRMEEQREQAKEQRGPRTYTKTYSTYSKRKSRYETFLNKNEGANAWDSEDDNEVFNHQRPKRSKMEDLEKQILDDDSNNNDIHNDEVMAAEEESDEHSVRGDLEDIAMEDNDKDDDDDDDDQTKDMEHVQDAAEGDEDVDSPFVDPKPERGPKRRTRRKLFKRKTNTTEDEQSDDDELFNGAVVTTPQKARRIVSPGTAGHTRLEDDDDDDDEDDDGNQVESQHQEQGEEDRAGLQNISDFFQSSGVNSRSKSKRTAKTKTSSSPSKQDHSAKRPSSDFFTRRKATKQTAPINNSPADSDDDDAMVALTTSAKQQRKGNDFFTRREAANSSDVSTVVPTPTTTQQSETDIGETDESIVSTPKRVKQIFFAGHKLAKKSVEEEDPIVDSPSANGSTMDRPVLSAPKRLFRGTYARRPQPNTATATMALQLADGSSPNRSSPRPEPFARSTTKPYNNYSSTAATTTTTTITRPSSPMAPLSKWRGLRNLGNSCYMNASLQMLYSVPSFIKAIQKSKDGRRLVSSVTRLWQDLQDHSRQGSGTPRAIKSAVDDNTDRFRGFHQRDAHEFLGHLLDQLHEELERPHEECVAVDENDGAPSKEGEGEDMGEEKKEEKSEKELEMASQSENHPKEELATDSVFRLNVEVCLKCKSCGYSRTKEEMYRYLSIDIDQTEKTVEKCLDSFFQPEDREIKCEKCEEGQIATQTMRALSRPKTLLLHLKRFVLVEKEQTNTNNDNKNGDNNNTETQKDGAARSPFEMTFQKNKAPVSLTESLSLDRYTAGDVHDSPNDGLYKLRSVVYHLGSTANSGHYTADAMRCDPDDDDDDKETWVSYDDGLTNETTLEKIQESRANQKAAYMLLYSLE